jgi:exportin-2 (importin alpha re-exporter)
MTLLVDPSTAQIVAASLQQTLHPQTQKQAEKALMAMETPQTRLGLVLLQLLLNESGSAVDANVRFAAALYFKNFIRRHWPQVGRFTF